MHELGWNDIDKTPARILWILKSSCAKVHFPDMSCNIVQISFGVWLMICSLRWATWTPIPWSYVLFNGGSRICLGQNIAMTEMAYASVRMYQVFERIENRNERRGRGLGLELILC
jgi:hypothetical protein